MFEKYFFTHFFFLCRKLTMELNNELKRENQSLRAQIQALKYENRMYKQLLDNLFLGGNQQTTAR